MLQVTGATVELMQAGLKAANHLRRKVAAQVKLSASQAAEAGTGGKGGRGPFDKKHKLEAEMWVLQRTQLALSCHGMMAGSLEFLSSAAVTVFGAVGARLWWFMCGAHAGRAGI